MFSHFHNYFQDSFRLKHITFGELRICHVTGQRNLYEIVAAPSSQLTDTLNARRSICHVRGLQAIPWLVRCITGIHIYT